ncbi:phage terminase large subunit [Pseudanabaena sp. FACHB-2040]|uniref:phage terminase large subunit n=1 Tax=Pseudanabaena sp. FACHB-2040 TaxID=2692859 RepID=UPI001682B4B2|nr:phage terminase large subunit [Pseudanabaena sp. FACHB-2040]
MALSSLKQWHEVEQWALAKKRQAEASDKVLTFREFVCQVMPSYQWYRHCEVLADILQEVADGKRHRLMIFMPPRHGKSQLTSRLFPAYYLYRHPERFVGISSYAADLAHGFSRICRENYRKVGGQIKNDSGQIKHWETVSGGGLWAAGVGGPITGKGYHLGLIDDPLKNHAEAFSETIRRGQKEWYESTFATREEPGGAQIVILTRWHEDDLAGWLLGREVGDDEESPPEHWHVVNLPAIAEDEAIKIPDTCTLEPDWRQPGQPLCPERYSLSRLAKFRKNPYFWAALFQQRPSPLEGDYFKRDWWQFYQQPPAKFDRVIISGDCAFKETSSSDFVVLQVWGVVGGLYYLLDQVRGRMDINATLTAVQALSAKWPQARAKLIEDKANGPAVIDLLKRKLPGMIPVNPEGGKVARAVAVSPYVQSGNVFLPESARWVLDFIEEFAAFPNGSHDDQVDAMTQAINWLETEARSHGPAQKSGRRFA